MKCKRPGIAPSVRIKVLVRDGFRCVYCGATNNDAKIEVDHVIPVASGGTSHIDNLVAACRECNSGKGASDVIDIMESDIGIYVKENVSPEAFGSVPSVALNDPMRESPGRLWEPLLMKRWTWVGNRPAPRRVGDDDFGTAGLFYPTFYCSGRANSDFGKSPCQTYVLVVPFRPAGGYSQHEREQIKAAVMCGYIVPTLIIMGTPSMFLAVLVNDRHKGNPRGSVVDQHLEPFDEWWNPEWYPDEQGDFQDLREPYRDTPELLCPRRYDFHSQAIFGVFCSFTGEAL